MIRRTSKAWLYLLPALLFLGFFMVYPLFDVFVYSVEEGYNSASQTYFGTGLYNYSYVLHDPYFLQAVKNTFIIVIITVPLSTAFALAISLALSSVKKLKEQSNPIFVSLIGARNSVFRQDSEHDTVMRFRSFASRNA